ncbi:alkaline phosphatase D family protein [Nocardiopsis rhodophaea]|uniref:alkaline phosphatase D family protein n=1 Tax=Nocardiopsis rhodophaea TaxID=280238 RepID=UPI0031E1FDF0
MGAALRLGPVLRNVTDTTATVWVETDAPCRVTVIARAQADAGGDTPAGAYTAHTPTFAVHGHHYALCDLSGLPAGGTLSYEVRLDDAVVWPQPDAPYPPSLVRTLDHAAPARILFGSCHIPTDHSPAAVARYGPDMLRAYALRLAERRRAGEGGEPTVLLLIGDQVYADELQPRMLEFLGASRADGAGERGESDGCQKRAEVDGPDGGGVRSDRSLRAHAARPPDDEVVFFDEYAELYRQAWSDPDLRWLLSTVPTLMLFDDHDIRDDWNTSGSWRRDIARTPWWAQRITSGLGAYWIYQHLGNLRPDQRAADPVFAAVRKAAGSGRDATGQGASGHGDAAPIVDAFAWRAHEEPGTYVWSSRFDIGRTRVLMVDTRCGRDVDDDARRSILGRTGTAWLDAQLTGDVDHLVVASTLPFLLPTAVHHLEAWNEAVCAGRWGRALRGFGERLRRAIDLEHWAAFQRSFRFLAAAVLDIAAGERGAPPATVLFLGGDVHFSYLARARPSSGAARRSATRITQLVCSPTCNRLPPLMGRLTSLSALRVAGAVGAVLSRLAGVGRPPLRWRLADGPKYQNALATLVLKGRGAEVCWEHVARAAAPAGNASEGDPLRPPVAELMRRTLSG